MNKNTNNTHEGFIVDYKLSIIFILALILCYFGLFAEGLRFFILSWEVEFINFISFLNFLLLNLYFFLVIIIFFLYRNSVKIVKLKYYLKKKNNILKRYYYINMLLLVNPFEMLKKGNFLTKKTIYNIYKSNLNISRKEVKSDFINNNVSSKTLQHYGQINGIKFYNESLIDMNMFTTYTNGDFHEISLDNIELSNLDRLNLIYPKLPTLKVDLKISNLEINKDLIFPNQSLVKTYISDNLKVIINSNDIHEFDLKETIEIKSNKEKVMDILGFKNYEFIDKSKQLYLVPKKDISKIGEIIVNINFANAEKINLEKVLAIGEKIISKKELTDYINVSPKLKEEYLKNSYEYLQYNKHLKKD